MGKWLKVDASLGDAFVSKTLSYLPGAGGSWSIEYDIVVPADTLTALAAQGYTSDLFHVFSGSDDGLFGQDDPPWTFQAFSGHAIPAAGITADAAVHIVFAATNTTGSTWHRVVTADGVTIIDATGPRFGNPTVDRLTGIDLGAIFATPVDGEIYYIDNVVVKDRDGSVLFSDDFEDGTTDAWDSVTGDATVVDFTPGGGGGGPVAPTNTDCASAEELTGCTGFVIADNRAWAGIWPAGSDPLFNALGHGGGAPLWWKWTNTSSRPMLFRVTVVDPPDHAVDYNLGIAVADDCGSIVFDDALASTYLGLGRELGNVSDEFVGDDFDPSIPSSFDIVVDPGHTVWVEVDSSTGDASEPPDASAALGKFKLEWSALGFTDYDTTEGADNVLPTDASTLLIDPVSPTAGQIVPFATLTLGDRRFMLWKANEDDGDSIFGGDCALDGSDLHTQRVWDAALGLGSLADGNVPQLLTDGTDVLIGFAWTQPMTSANPGYTDSCGAHAPVFLCTECDDASVRNRYSLFRWVDDGTWEELVGSVTMGVDPALITFGFDLSTVAGHTDVPRYAVRACASPAVPGKVHIHACYRITEIDQTLHHNDYPITETPPGSLWCTDERTYVTEYAETIEIGIPAGGSPLATNTGVANNANTLGNFQTWNHDDETIDPAFAQWQFFDDGDLLTADTTPRDSIDHGGFDIRNDDGYPVVAYCPCLTVTPSGWVKTLGNDVIFVRPDTGAVLGTWSYDDVAAGYESDSDQTCTELRMSARFANPFSGVDERGLATKWTGGAAARSWTDRIKSDGSVAPGWIVDGDPNSSLVYFGVLFPDAAALVAREWWGQGVADSNTFFHYDYCGTPGWRSTYDGWHGPDDLGADYVISPFSAFDADTETFYFLNGINQLRSAQVLRGYFICDEGEPCRQQIRGWLRVRF